MPIFYLKRQVKQKFSTNSKWEILLYPQQQFCPEWLNTYNFEAILQFSVINYFWKSERLKLFQVLGLELGVRIYRIISRSLTCSRNFTPGTLLKKDSLVVLHHLWRHRKSLNQQVFCNNNKCFYQVFHVFLCLSFNYVTEAIKNEAHNLLY